MSSVRVGVQRGTHDQWVPCPGPVVTDDAADLHVSFDSDRVLVGFRDWQGDHVELVFDDVAAFRWLDFSSAGVESLSGSLCILHASSWVVELAEQGRLDGRDEPALHFRADFDLLGVLDVAASGVKATRVREPSADRGR